MLEIKRMDDPKGLRIEGELDLATVDRFRSSLAAMVREGGDIFLDVGDMRFMDSSGAQVLIRALRDLADRGRLVLARPQRTVLRLVRLMGLERFENLEIQ